MKTVYLARHGQTDANVSQKFQGEEEPLNDVGVRQAAVLAERAQHLDFEKLIVSDYRRTRQTAEPILDVTDVPVTYSANFREEKPPSSWVGERYEHETEGKQFFHDMVANVNDPEWRVEDAENAHDIFQRIEKAIAELETEEAQNIFVVSHGTFLKQLIAYVLLDCKGSVADVVSFKKTLKTANTGISIIQHDGTRWRVLTWNDHAHFAE